MSSAPADLIGVTNFETTSRPLKNLHWSAHVNCSWPHDDSATVRPSTHSQYPDRFGSIAAVQLASFAGSRGPLASQLPVCRHATHASAVWFAAADDFFFPSYIS